MMKDKPGMLFLLARCNLLLVILLLSSSSLGVAGVVDFSPGLLRYVSEKWGGEATERLQGWRATGVKCVSARQKLQSSGALPWDDLRTFNVLLNKVHYYSDLRHWGVEDYWATPVEMLTSNGADCEDYSIAKYFSLRELGVPIEHLRITYVRALELNEAHMVLAYYPTPDADPYILDNLTDSLVPASQRPDLEPVYSFNDEDLWAAGDAAFKGKSSQIRSWREVLDKMEKERNM